MVLGLVEILLFQPEISKSHLCTMEKRTTEVIYK